MFEQLGDGPGDGGDEKRGNTPVSVKAFIAKLTLLSESIDNISLLEDVMATLPKNESLRVKGVYINRRDIGAFKTTLKHEIESLKREYVCALRYRKKIKPDKKRLIQFVVKLKPGGVALLADDASLPPALLAKLPMLAQGYTLNNTLMALSSIYTRTKKLNLAGNRLGADDHMKRALRPYAAELKAKGFTNLDNFNYTRWSTIWSLLKADLSKPERVLFLKENYAALTQECADAKAFLASLK